MSTFQQKKIMTHEKKWNMVNTGGGGTGRKQSLETPWGSPDVGLKGQRFKSASINIFKEQKETTSEKLDESMRTMSHQIENICEEVDIIIFKKNQTKIPSLKSNIMEM